MRLASQYSPDYVALLSVLAHEVGHIDNNHIIIRKDHLGPVVNEAEDFNNTTLIILLECWVNSLNNKGAGFNLDTNKITIIDKNNNITNFKLKDKKDVAKDIFDSIINNI